MTYDDLVAEVARLSGMHSDVVRRVLVRLPEVLHDLPLGDSVRTPMGTFRKTKREPRTVILPDGKTPSQVTERIVVKLKPSGKLVIGESEDSGGS